MTSPPGAPGDLDGSGPWAKLRRLNWAHLRSRARSLAGTLRLPPEAADDIFCDAIELYLDWLARGPEVTRLDSVHRVPPPDDPDALEDWFEDKLLDAARRLRRASDGLKSILAKREGDHDGPQVVSLEDWIAAERTLHRLEAMATQAGDDAARRFLIAVRKGAYRPSEIERDAELGLSEFRRVRRLLRRWLSTEETT